MSNDLNSALWNLESTTTFFFSYAKDIERLQKKRSTWNPVKYVKNRKDKDFDTEVLNATHGLEAQCLEYVVQSFAKNVVLSPFLTTLI